MSGADIHIHRLKRKLADGKIDRREFLRTTTLLGISAATAFTMAGKISGSSAFAAGTGGNLPQGGTVKLGSLLKEVKTPHTASHFVQANITRQVCDYLTQTGADNITRPALVESWEVSEDIRSWTFRLRRDVKWHSGRDFTADDVIWNLKRVLDVETGSSMLGLMKAYMLRDVEGGTDAAGQPQKRSELWDANAIEKVDDHTFRLNCRVPQIAVPEHLFHYPFVIMDPDEGGVFGPGANGTGAFELLEYQPARRAVLRGRKDYWGAGPNLDTLEFQDLGDDPGAAIGALASRQVHGIAQADITMVGTLAQLGHLEIHRALSSTSPLIRAKASLPPFNDKRVMMALKLATDVSKLSELALREFAAPGEYHHVAPIHPEYADVGSLKRDVAAARRLLAEAGYEDGLDLTLDIRTNPQWFQVMAEGLIEQWKEVGVRLALNPMPQQQYSELWSKTPLGITHWFHRPLGVMMLGLAYRSGVPWNETDWSNAEFDELLTEAEGLVDPDERREVIAKLERIMQDDAPIILPFWQEVFTFMDKSVAGFEMHPSLYIFGNQLARHGT